MIFPTRSSSRMRSSLCVSPSVGSDGISAFTRAFGPYLVLCPELSKNKSRQVKRSSPFPAKPNTRAIKVRAHDQAVRRRGKSGNEGFAGQARKISSRGRGLRVDQQACCRCEEK